MENACGLRLLTDDELDHVDGAKYAIGPAPVVPPIWSHNPQQINPGGPMIPAPGLHGVSG
jgi:hypothetical protein